MGNGAYVGYDAGYAAVNQATCKPDSALERHQARMLRVERKQLG